jgi:hypothetical protein
MIIQIPKGADLKLSEHFTAKEFQCTCANCNVTLVSAELVEFLEYIRVQIGEPIQVTSGYRCKPHNKFVGGALNSLHTEGLAADFRTVSRNNLEALYSLCLSHRAAYEKIRALKPTRSPIGIGGLGRYERRMKNVTCLSRIHVDLRPAKTLVTWTKPA